VGIRGYYATGLLDPRIVPVPAGAHLGVMSFLCHLRDISMAAEIILD
jgi:hypothetical protein